MVKDIPRIMLKVVMISLYDYADSGKRIMESLSKYTYHQCHYISIYNKSITYPPVRRKQPLSTGDVLAIQEADVIIYKGDELLTVGSGWNMRIIEKSGRNVKVKTKVHKFEVKIPQAKRILLAGGGGFRRLTKGDNTNTFQWFEFSDYKVDMFLSISPEMAYHEINCKHLGFTIDSESMENTWKMSNPLRVYAYDSPKTGIDRKGARTHLFPAIDRLRNEGYEIDLVVAKNLTYQENLKLKSTASICFENIAEYGCYGNSGVEALAMGIPLMCWISDESIAQAGYNYGECVFNVKNSDDVYRCLRDILIGLTDLEIVSVESKEYCDKYHSYRAIANKLNQYLIQCTEN
jgi:hypothetical protein